MRRIPRGPGPVALLGSGEFLPGMESLDRALLAGCASRVVHLPTAAAPDGRARFAHWMDLCRSHFARLGAGDVVTLAVRDRIDAQDPALAAQVAGADLVYLSGGNPGYLADALDGTAVLRAVVAAWRAGAAVAGCSAGAMALTTTADDVARRCVRPGLGLLPHLSLICHFGRAQECWPGTRQRRLGALEPGQSLVGLEENTAIVGGPERWQVYGAGRVWLYTGGEWVPHAPGDEVTTPATAAVDAAVPA